MRKAVINEPRSHGSGLCEGCRKVEPKLYSSLVTNKALCVGCMLSQARACDGIYGPSEQVVVKQIPNRYYMNWDDWTKFA